jgi:fructose/tagatose bisphosphate aldolase
VSVEAELGTVGGEASIITEVNPASIASLHFSKLEP